MAFSVRSFLTAAVGLCTAVALQPAPAQAQVYRGVPVNQGGYIRYAPGPLVGGGGYARPIGVPGRGYGVRPGGYGPGIGRVPYYRPVAGGYRGPVYGPGWRGSYYGRPYVAPRYYPYRRYYGGYYPYRRYYGSYYPYGYYGGYYGGGALAAGLIGGLALGAITASQPY